MLKGKYPCLTIDKGKYMCNTQQKTFKREANANRND